MKYPATLNVNGISYHLELEPHRSLLSVVRNDLGLTGAKEGCDDSECGACMMLVDNLPVNACSFLALQADCRAVTTIEGLAAGQTLTALQQEILEQGGVQCGFCTPGMLMSATAVLAGANELTEEDVRIALGGNLCRCTGYKKIVQAVLQVAERQTHHVAP